MNLLVVSVLALVFATTAPAVEARGRIFNGQDAQPQQFPSLVRFQTEFGNQVGLCSGTIIGLNWIMTAAHCLVNNGLRTTAIVLFMGSNQKNVNEPYFVIYPVTANNVIIHENFNRTGKLENDIALLKVENMTLNANIQIAKLPTFCSSKKLSYEGDNMTVAAWGSLDNKGSLSSFAQWNIYSVIERAYCEYFYGTVFFESQLCLYKDNSSICLGDSGGPGYICQGARVAGIASFIPSTGCEGFSLMVFTNVNFFVDWIYEKTNLCY